jgi:hypothetical protein
MLYMLYFLHIEPFTSLSSPLNAVFYVLRGPVSQDAGTPSLSQLQYLRTCSRRRVKKKSHLFHTNRRYGRAGSGASRSAFHYDYTQRVIKDKKCIHYNYFEKNQKF